MTSLDRRLLSRAIWQEVFEDEESFLDLYFTQVYRDDETDLLIDYGTLPRAIAHTGRLSYFLRLWGKQLPASYISGAATISSERGRGLMPTLLYSSHSKMYQTGKILSFLIPAEPWLYQYYERKFGYAQVCYRRVIEQTDSFPSSPLAFQQESNASNYIEYIRQRKHWIVGHIEHTYSQWRNVIADAALSGGGYTQRGILRLLQGEKQVQFVATRLPIDEENRYNQIVAPPEGEAIRPHGMMRAINIPQLLALYAKWHPQVERQFDLFDSILHPNTGRYLVSKGRLLFYPLPLERLEKNFLSPSQLLEQLFADPPFYIDLMMD